MIFKKIKGYLILIMTLFSISAFAEENEITFIGVPEREGPYIYIDDGILKGFAKNFLDNLCDSLSFDCELIPDKFDENLIKLRQNKIDLFLTINSPILPEEDRVMLSEPLCQSKTILIKKLNNNEKPTTDDDKKIKGKTIGVKKGSFLHLALLENFYNFVTIRPYELLESGIFDLYFNRIDMLLTEETYYEEKISNSFKSNKNHSEMFTKFEVAELSAPDMLRLVTTITNNDLYEKIEAAIQKMEKTSCTKLAVQYRADQRENLIR